MYMIFYLNQDGDTYSLHPELDSAQDVFSKRVADWSEAVNSRQKMGWDDWRTLLCEITDPKDFGFGTHGDVYGMEIIDSIEWEDS